ncbi:PAS domain-containing hybrid sensor histidine kinase/response regulator [Labrenzia sp. VG12]|uniref:PAS domain-containing hybrid sensor histidine kinase/response regulator n=1 Tax=Labrenzia sp. VG12 TaxID=2021862 RepID=UPI000B8C4E8F|nr:PAS domain-containing hybrid sensor histidine kinase/response regulator [Labrenzia sp. VG12]ASP37000.1 hybrid sensor histidine kinase/response regulator [Labrenzia sp. VG12]
MVSQNSDRAAKAVPEADVAEQDRFADNKTYPPQEETGYSPFEEAESPYDDDGPEVGPGRRATDLPVSAPAKSLQHMAVVGLVIGLVAGFFLVSTDGINRYFGLGLAFFAGGLAVWRLFADDMHRAIQAVQLKDDKIRRLMARCEELEDRAWELGESDERHASILATLGDVVIRRDQDGLVTYVNSAATDVFGAEHHLQPGEPMTLPLAASGSGAQNDKVPEANGPSGMGFQDLHLETAQGHRWFSRIDIPVRDTTTDRQLVQTVLRDVTERRLIEEELLAARHSAESSNEAKSRFLATVSHEIRTPLNGVLGMAALLRDTRLTKEQSAYIEALETSGETLLLLIDEVLDFSKVEAGKLDIQASPVRVGALVESVVELLAPKAHAKKLEIGAMLDPSLPEQVTLDATRVRQILFNLIGNGVKFTDEGGVAIELSGRPAPDGGSYLDIDVRDTGIGFDQEEAERLFQEFEQVDHGPARKFGGTGLGLAIAQRLAGLMGGEISASPSGEGGALFRVSLPIPEALSENQDPRLDKVAGRKVIFVSNSQIECPLLAERLRRHQADVAVLAPGNPELDARLATADLLIVDNAALSDSGGWLATVRLTGCQAPAIVMIAPPERERLEHLREAGYAAYLIRPVRIETLAQILAGLLDDAGEDHAWDVSAEPVSNGFLSSRHKMPARPLRLLVAEDNDINRLLSEAMLRKLGHVPVMVVDGEKAVEEASNGSYDAILMDLHMPGLDGFQAIRQIRSDEAASGRQPVPVLIVTADVMKDARDKAAEVGAAGYLTKPLSVEAISDALSEIGRQ